MVRLIFKPRTSRVLIPLVLGTAFLIAAVVLVVAVSTTMWKQVTVEAESKARTLMDRALAVHTKFTGELKPRLFEFTDPFRPEGYFEPGWMSSSYAVRRINKYFHGLDDIDYYIKDAVIDARSLENEADTIERAFIDGLNTDPGLMTRSSVQRIDDTPDLVFIRRGRPLKSCAFAATVSLQRHRKAFYGCMERSGVSAVPMD